MKKNKFNNNAGLSLIEILIGVVISAIMMAAMYTTYSVVNNSYSQVTDRAKISRSGRDIIGMLMRDIRLAGFKYYFGINNDGISKNDYLQYVGGNSTISESHDPIIIVKDELGYTTLATADATPSLPTKNNSNDMCCDKIHIVYGDFDQSNTTQPYKKYKITYYALPRSSGSDKYYAIYKTKESWIQKVTETSGSWTTDPSLCSECYTGELIRDHLTDMEFIAFDKQGRILNPPPSPDNAATRGDLYNIRIVDVRLTFRSKKEFFRFNASADKPRLVKGLGDRTREFLDKYLRDSVVVTVHTRNIGN
tara:strand:+ start:221 stop:1141 length:921 start_codon:yes stop_codon:yes gene_type:complete